MGKLTPQQALRAFNLSQSELERLVRIGAVKPERTSGGHRRFDEADLARALLEAQQTATRQQPVTFNELGGTGLWGTTSRLWEDPNNQLRGLQGRKILREMRTDPVIAAVFLAIENALRQAEWRVVSTSDTPVDQEAKDFLSSCLKDMSFSWGDTIQFALQMLEQGFSVLEVVYKKRMPQNSRYPDGRIGWRKLAPRPAETISEWRLDEYGGIQGVVQDLPDGRRVEIPIEKILLFRTSVAPANEPEGRPIHRAAFAPWWFTRQLQEIEGIGIERDLAGLPVVYLGDDCTLSGDNSDFAAAKLLVERLRRDEQAGVVIPKPKMGLGSGSNGILLELLTTGGRRQINTSEVIERYDSRKALSILAQFIMLGITQRGGSFALSEQQTDLFTIAVSAWLQGIADVFNRYGVARLFALNHFPGLTALPELRASSIGMPNLKEVADYVNQLTLSKVLTPDDELERHLRQLARFPQREGAARPEERGGPRLTPEEASILLRRAALAARAADRLGAVTPEEAKLLVQTPLQEFQEAMGVELPPRNGKNGIEEEEETREGKEL